MTSRPSLRQLQYFRSLVETGHFGRAADLAGISQPSLSLQIANLEERLGLRLIERRRRGVVPTPEGREVHARAVRVLEELDALVDIAARLETGIGGTIRLGSTPTIGPYLLPGLIRRLRMDHPEVKLVLSDAAPRELTAALGEGRLDAVLTQLPVDLRAVTVTRLFREPLLLAMPHDHPLAARDSVEEGDLSGQDLLTLSPAYALHDQVPQIAQAVGAVLRRDYEGTSLDALRQMVAMNMGLAFMPALYVRSEISAPRGDVAVRPFRRGRVARSVGLVWRCGSGRSAALQRLSDVTRQVIRAELAAHVIPEA